MTRAISRRRFIRISAATAGFVLAPSGRAAQAEAVPVTWRGTMLGAIATLEIHHQDSTEARRLIAAAISEARRLERLFSLYLADSALVELNRTGVLVDPTADLVELLQVSQRYAEITQGMFDPTVQPLWELYADHFSRADADPAGPPRDAAKAALAKVGHVRLQVSRNRIAMPRGSKVTLNGIAQGYITDKVVELLRSHGTVHSLVDMGETRAMDSRPDGTPWEIGIADPEIPGRTTAVLPVVDRAVSTSGAYGFQFDTEGRFNHLFNPLTGGCADRYRSVTTVSRSATAADALSTAFSFMTVQQIKSLLPQADIERVHLIDGAGAGFELTA
jgi:thiamine biosynthesis lipoprotein